MNRHFSNEEVGMAIRHMKKCSSSLAIRESQIKTTLRYHLTAVRMRKIKKARNNKWWRGCGERGILLHCWWECNLVQPLWETVSSFLKKLKIDLLYDPVIPLLDIYPKKMKTLIQKETYTPLFLLLHYLQQPRYESNWNVHQWING